ncbi:MAG: Uma2 family endonuclease [Nostocaceae cyanobacterium]|nr:Uma2 family endonuclease [Nostocaceae cyanobacterium]
MIYNHSDYYIAPQDYLESEKISLIKHEYTDGQVYQISAGRSDAHVTIALNLSVTLRYHLRGTKYRVFMADMKAQIEDINRYFYPDIMVTNNPRDKEYKYFKRYPCLIVEVLSDATEAYDRGKKFSDYRELDSLQEYVLISQDVMSVDCFRRNEKGRWELFPYVRGDEVYLESVDLRFDIADIYEDVPLIVDSMP